LYQGVKVIDVHGHLSTPPHFRAHAMNLVALRTPDETVIAIPEAAMKQALDRHLRFLDERNIDVQLISPRPVAMLHWERPFLVEAWSRTTNDVIAGQCKLYPERFVGVAQLPQAPDLNIPACVAELDRAIKELGFVGAILNPDPGGDRQAPGVDDEAWFPLYERAERLNATLVIHPSITRDPRVEKIPHSYQYNNMTEETLATLLYERGEVFQRFPELRILVCHCGGCLRRLLEIGDIVDATRPPDETGNRIPASGEQGGGQVGTQIAAPAVLAHPVKPDLSANLFFDTCAYDPWFLGAAIRQRGPSRMAFGTEAPGSGAAIRNPQTGKTSDDILAVIEQFDFLSRADKIAMVHDNPLRVFPLLKGKAGLA
jgi:predicted TIM-barrel fold metal-dependent hydrolase